MVRMPDSPLMRLQVYLTAIQHSGNRLTQDVYRDVPVTKQCNLVPVLGQRCTAAGKVTVGWALHWPCITDFSGLSTYGSRPNEGG